MSKEKEATIGMKSSIRVELIVAVLPMIGLLLMIWFEMRGIKDTIRKGWTIQHQMLFNNQLTAKNPGIIVPSASDIVDQMNKQADHN